MTAAENDEAKEQRDLEQTLYQAPELTLAERRKLMAKIDWHLLPVLCILYLLAFLDRVNISNAAIFGLQKDLDIVTGTKYNTALTIFFVPYVLLEIPSNILLRKLRPHVWLSFCMFMFGLVMACQGVVSNWGGLMTTRFFLGVFETGMFPGCFYLMGMWYKRSEAQKRFTFFFSSTTLAGAFGGLLATGIGQMNGLRGYSGWRWIFIIEGVLTCVVSFFWFFAIPDFPEDVKWLSDAERAYLKAKLAKDVGASARYKPLNRRDILGVFKDYKIFIGGFMYFGFIVPAYGYAYFAPTIIKTYGFSATMTQLYSIPPWAAAFGFSMAIAFLSDRFRHRFVFTLIPLCVAIAGFAILLTTHGQAHRHVEYGALFLVTSGVYSAMPVVVCWFAMNLSGHTRRSVGIAWQIGFGNIGGIIATYSFLSKDAPNFRNGYIICLSFCCLAVASCTIYLLSIWSQNRGRNRNVQVSSAPELSEQDILEVEAKGDLAPGYRYIY